VFVYYFDQFRPVSLYPGGTLSGKVQHIHSELVYVFGHLKQKPDAKVTDEEQTLSDKMIKYWTNFAKSGDPNDRDTTRLAVYRKG